MQYAPSKALNVCTQCPATRSGIGFRFLVYSASLRVLTSFVLWFPFTSTSFRVFVLLTLRLGNAERSTECCVPGAAY